jgi:hypothetical protein
VAQSLEDSKMKISVGRLKQIIKEELENIARYDRDHPREECGDAHPGQTHEIYVQMKTLQEGEEEYSATNEELEDILAEDDWDFLGEDDLYED